MTTETSKLTTDRSHHSSLTLNKAYVNTISSQINDEMMKSSMAYNVTDWESFSKHHALNIPLFDFCLTGQFFQRHSRIGQVPQKQKFENVEAGLFTHYILNKNKSPEITIPRVLSTVRRHLSASRAWSVDVLLQIFSSRASTSETCDVVATECNTFRAFLPKSSISQHGCSISLHCSCSNINPNLLKNLFKQWQTYHYKHPSSNEDT